MARALLVKLMAAVLVVLALRWLPSPLSTVAATLTVLATLGFFAFVIVAPHAQFLVPSRWRLPASAEDAAIAFTFDDGPDPTTTPRILDVLAEHGAKATFFVVGTRALEHPGLLQRMLAEGHAIGSHTFHHSHAFHFSSPSRMRADVQRGIDAVASVTGTPPRLFRPPQGLRTPLLRDALRPLRELVCVTWTERGLDTIGRPAAAIVRRLAWAVRPSSILTLHDGGGFGGTRDRAPTVEALTTLLELAAQRNLRCVTLHELEKP